MFWRKSKFAQEGGVIFLVVKRKFVGAPIFGIGAKQSVMKGGEGVSVDAEMVGAETVVLKINSVVIVINRRCVEGVPNGLSPMLPSRINKVVVIVVCGTYLVRQLFIL